MAESTLVIPKNITPNTLNDYFKIYSDWALALKDEESLVVDLRGCDFMSPIALNHMMSFTDKLVSEGRKVSARFAKDPQGITPKMMGYFGFFTPEMQDLEALPFIKDYLVPITRIKSAPELMEAVTGIGDLIETRTGCNKYNRAATEWLLTEIADNSGTHGYGNYRNEDYKKVYDQPVYVSAFSFEDKVEVAILDTGMGILKSLQGKHPVENGKDALRMAIKKGVSGHPIHSPGFGLFGASELCRLGGGTLSIWSSKALLKVQNGRAEAFNSSFNVGTAVCFEVGMNMESAFKEVLNRDIEEYADDFWS